MLLDLWCRFLLRKIKRPGNKKNKNNIEKLIIWRLGPAPQSPSSAGKATLPCPKLPQSTGNLSFPDRTSAFQSLWSHLKRIISAKGDPIPPPLALLVRNGVGGRGRNPFKSRCSEAPLLLVNRMIRQNGGRRSQRSQRLSSP